ncbi:uncharacterized protein LOC135483366 [Lineus longissimus]|uniref:uncharacterized protein LOC135483366 n=1 Tax=Lineus longissimus TaxID=88925 RepID=UPI00315CBEF5
MNKYTGDAKPFKQAPRKVPMAFAGEELKSLKKMLNQGIVRESTSPWASGVVLVRKRDGGVRHCVDYRMLNKLTTNIPATPLPRCDTLIDKLSGSVYFSALDVTSAYHNVPIREQDIPKTAFATTHGLFEYLTMPMGLPAGSPMTFQRLIELAMKGLVPEGVCALYLDDIITFSVDFESHIVKLRKVFTRIRDAGFKLKPSKCHLLQLEVNFLGHTVSKDGVKPNAQKLKDWPVPRNVTDVRGIIGLGSYYRRFIKDFSSLMHPLIQLTKKGVSFHWSGECEAAFKVLLEKLTGPEAMAFPRPEDTFILDTDACDVGIGAVLSQVQDGRERVIAYASATLNKAQRYYCVTDRELLAVKHFIEYFCQYLLGKPFICRVDHMALKWLFSLKDPKGRVARWIEILSAYQFTLEWRPGKKHQNADSMSRCPNPMDCACPTNGEDIPCGLCAKCDKKSADMQSTMYPGTQPVRRITRARNRPNAQAQPSWALPYAPPDLRRHQAKDPDIGQILSWFETGTRPFGAVVCEASQATRHYWNCWDSLTLTDGILFRKFSRKDGTDHHEQFLVPRVLRSEVLREMHDSPLAGHLGKKKCREKTLQRFYCKWAEVFATPDQTATTTANLILNEVIARFGTPIDIHSDQGRNYESNIFKELCRLLEIRKTRASPANPRCNGQCERFNKTLIRMIKAYLKGQQDQWDVNLGCLAAAYRATPNESTKLTPNLLMLGREVRLPAEVMFPYRPGIEDDEITSYGEYVDKLRDTMVHAHDVARENLKAAAERHKQNHDGKVVFNKYKVGDGVWYLTDISQLEIAPKLRKAFQGPYLIIKKVNDLDYVLQMDKRGKTKLVHHNKLKPYEGQSPPLWFRSMDALAFDLELDAFLYDDYQPEGQEILDCLLSSPKTGPTEQVPRAATPPPANPAPSHLSQGAAIDEATFPPTPQQLEVLDAIFRLSTQVEGIQAMLQDVLARVDPPKQAEAKNVSVRNEQDTPASLSSPTVQQEVVMAGPEPTLPPKKRARQHSPVMPPPAEPPLPRSQRHQRQHVRSTIRVAHSTGHLARGRLPEVSPAVEGYHDRMRNIRKHLNSQRR